MFPSQDGDVSFRGSPHLPVDSGREFSVSFSETHGPCDPSCELIGSIRQTLLLYLELGGLERRGSRGGGVAGSQVKHNSVQSIELHRDDDGLNEEVAGERQRLANSAAGVVGELQVHKRRLGRCVKSRTEHSRATEL